MGHSVGISPMSGFSNCLSLGNSVPLNTFEKPRLSDLDPDSMKCFMNWLFGVYPDFKLHYFNVHSTFTSENYDVRTSTHGFTKFLFIMFASLVNQDIKLHYHDDRYANIVHDHVHNHDERNSQLGHTYTIVNITNLQTELNNRLSLSG